MKKNLTKLTAICILIVPLAGCASFHEKYKEQAWTPDGFNYTLQRDRATGEMSDYFGLTWSFK